MKKLSILAMGLLFVLTTACSVSGSGTLFDGKDSNKWKMTGDVSPYSMAKIVTNGK